MRFPIIACLAALALCGPAGAAGVRGTAFGPGDQPLPGVRVTLSGSEGVSLEAFTDAEGAFRFPHVASGKVHLNPEARLLAGQPSTFEVKPNEETAAPDLKLCEAGDVECVLKGLPAATGPAPLMLMALAEAQSPDGRAVPASAATRLYIRGGGAVRVDPGAAPLPAGATDILSYNTGGMIHLLYPPGTRIAFNPFSPPGPPNAPVAGETTTLRQVPVGRCRVSVVLPRSGDGMVLLPGPSVSVAAGQTARAEITIAPGGKLSGRLPPAPATGGRGESQVWLFRRETLDLAGMAMARADGTFSLDGLAPGDYLAAVWLPGHAGVWQPFTIRAGETTEVAVAPAKGVPLRGRVEGERPKGILVCAESETSFDAGQVADDGTFAIEHLTPGAYTLRLWAPGKEKVVTRAGVQVGENGAEGVMVKWQ